MRSSQEHARRRAKQRPCVRKRSTSRPGTTSIHATRHSAQLRQRDEERLLLGKSNEKQRLTSGIGFPGSLTITSAIQPCRHPLDAIAERTSLCPNAMCLQIPLPDTPAILHAAPLVCPVQVSPIRLGVANRFGKRGHPKRMCGIAARGIIEL
jgi:hypothetical protein